ncbi:MAG: hypothetical protein ACRED1_12205, partial [Limisphaerales bacterium]
MPHQTECPVAERDVSTLNPCHDATVDPAGRETVPCEMPGGLATAPGHHGYLGPATVLRANERERLALVQWERAGQTCLSWARLALA